MSLETEIVAALTAVCPRTFPDVAPAGTATPYLVWQLYGGQSVTYVEGALPNTRNGFLQVTAWTPQRLESNTLIQQVEAALLAAPGLQARADSALQSAYDKDTTLRGAMQDFDIWAAR